MKLDTLLEDLGLSLKYFNVDYELRHVIDCKILLGKLVLSHGGKEIHLDLNADPKEKT